MSNESDSKSNLDGKKRAGRPGKLMIDSDGSASSTIRNAFIPAITPTPGYAQGIASVRNGTYSLQSGPTYVTPSYSNISPSYHSFFTFSPHIQNTQPPYTYVGYIPTSNVSPSSMRVVDKSSMASQPRLTYTEIINAPSANNLDKNTNRNESKAPSKKKSAVVTLSTDEKTKGEEDHHPDDNKVTNEKAIDSNEPSKPNVPTTIRRRRKRLSKSIQDPSMESDCNVMVVEEANDEQRPVHPRKQRAYIPPLDSIYQQEDILLFSPAHSDTLTFNGIKNKKKIPKPPVENSS